MLAKSIFKASSARLVSNKQSVRNLAKVLSQQKSVIGLTPVSARMFSNIAVIEKSV
jgi:hypothetical protein